MPENVKLQDGVEVGKPVDWIDELDGECLTISVSHQVDELTGMPMLVTGWQFSEQELKDMLSGDKIFFLAIGAVQHPVIKMVVHDGNEPKDSPSEEE